MTQTETTGCGGCQDIRAGRLEGEHAWFCHSHTEATEPTRTEAEQQRHDDAVRAYETGPRGGWAEEQDRPEDNEDNL